MLGSHPCTQTARSPWPTFTQVTRSEKGEKGSAPELVVGHAVVLEVRVLDSTVAHGAGGGLQLLLVDLGSKMPWVERARGEAGDIARGCPGSTGSLDGSHVPTPYTPDCMCNCQSQQFGDSSSSSSPTHGLARLAPARAQLLLAPRLGLIQQLHQAHHIARPGPVVQISRIGVSEACQRVGAAWCGCEASSSTRKTTEPEQDRVDTLKPAPDIYVHASTGMPAHLNFLPSSPSTRPKPTWSMRGLRGAPAPIHPAFLAAANTISKCCDCLQRRGGGGM